MGNDPAIVPDEAVIPVPPSTPPKPDEQAPTDVEEQPAEEAQAEETEAEEEPEEEEKPKSKTSGYARLKARHQRLLAELEALKQPQGQPPPQEPRIEDFNGDYLAFEKASVAFAAKQAIREEMAQEKQKEAQIRDAESRHETIEDFFERTEEIKTKLKDFDSVIDQMYGNLGPLPVTVRDRIAAADNGPQILYYLAKNPGAAREMYEAGPLDQVYQIGRLDEKMALPSARKETRAPPPINSPRGGAAPPKDIFQLAAKSEDIADYVRARRKDKGPPED